MLTNNHQKGISVLFVVLVMSVILSISLGLSVIFTQQTKMLTEVSDSVISFYAADSGVERELYDLYKAPSPMPSYSNPIGNASYTVSTVCRNVAKCFPGFPVDPVNCAAPFDFCIKSIGSYSNTERAVQVNY